MSFCPDHSVGKVSLTETHLALSDLDPLLKIETFETSYNMA